MNEIKLIAYMIREIEGSEAEYETPGQPRAITL